MSQFGVQFDLSTHQIGRDFSQHEMGIGDGGLLTPLTIASRSRGGACGTRSDRDPVCGTDSRNGPAAGTDRNDIDRGCSNRVDIQLCLRRDGQVARFNQGHVGRGSPHVEGNDVFKTALLAQPGHT